jgi:hypothetical protein
VFGREFTNGSDQALVLYRPKSVGSGGTAPGNGDNTAVWVDLGGSYQEVDPVTGIVLSGAPIITQILMRANEGKILIAVSGSRLAAIFAPLPDGGDEPLQSVMPLSWSDPGVGEQEVVTQPSPTAPVGAEAVSAVVAVTPSTDLGSDTSAEFTPRWSMWAPVSPTPSVTWPNVTIACEGTRPDAELSEPLPVRPILAASLFAEVDLSLTDTEHTEIDDSLISEPLGVWVGPMNLTCRMS